MSFKKLVRFSFLSLSASALLACSHKMTSKPDVVADPQIANSFGVEKPSSTVSTNLLNADHDLINIRQDALGKEFLLQGEIISQPIVPQFNGLKSRVVMFKKAGDQIYMLEASQGRTATMELPQNFLLARFPILHEKDGVITFDFNKGMTDLFTESDWHSQDDEGPQYNPNDEFQAARVNISYIDHAELTAENQLSIRQVAQLVSGNGDSLQTTPVAVQYYLTPYAEDKTFTPTVAHGYNYDHFGYFETAPQLNSRGQSVIYVSKFNIKKPIVYAISSNTPKEYRQAVKDGVLYWNKAFGRTVVKVIDAPKGVFAPNPNYNIVQWVNWDAAGFSYADAQMDPRTGETLHAQVFLTSAFAFLSKQDLIRILKRMETTTPQALATQARLKLSGFQLNNLCDLDMSAQLTKSLKQLLNSNVSDQTLLKISQDDIREVVAHEVGHTLGLRHNFAGSIAENYPLSQRTDLFKQYVETGNAPQGIVTSSSVMDYQLFDESVITGDQIAKLPHSLKYDEMAIRSLYEDQKYSDDSWPLFCTDPQVAAAGGFVDCQTFDIGSSQVEYAKWSFQQTLQSLPYTVIERFLDAKAPMFGGTPLPLSHVSLNVSSAVISLLGPEVNLLNAMTTDGKVLKVQRNFPMVSDINKDEVIKAQMDYLDDEVKKQGGIEAIFPLISSDFAEVQYARLIEILDSGIYNKGTNGAGGDYELSAQDIDTIKSMAHLYFEKLQDALIKADLAALKFHPFNPDAKAASVKQVFPDHPLSAEIAALIVKRTEHYLLAKTSKVITADIEVPSSDKSKGFKKISLRLPVFTYSNEIRSEAATILSSDNFEAPEWKAFAEQKVQKDFQETLKKAVVGAEIGDIKIDGLGPDIARWVLQNKALAGSLPKP